MIVIEILSYVYRSVLDYFYHKKNHLSIMSIEETLRYINEAKISCARFGDGEFKLIFNEDIGFQTAVSSLKNDLSLILQSNSDKCLICLPGAWEHSKLYTANFNHFWKRHLIRNRKSYYALCSSDYRYGNADITRCYLGIKDKSKVFNYFELNKKLWDQKNILIVEGDKTRLGIGNDLFNNAKSIRRILCPARNAYDKKDEILKVVEKIADKKELIIVSLGPAATVICFELANKDYYAVDVGNIDKEYEWFLSNATKKTANPIKDIIEINHQQPVEDCMDPTYLQQIIYKIDS
ncbi:MAG: SP_1767 family glycosyltransferase [Clostridia bacterium]|nr:SP_1767 family glycosyltransferase [Clostridia bacterium]